MYFVKSCLFNKRKHLMVMGAHHLFYGAVNMSWFCYTNQVTENRRGREGFFNNTTKISMNFYG